MARKRSLSENKKMGGGNLLGGKGDMGGGLSTYLVQTGNMIEFHKLLKANMYRRNINKKAIMNEERFFSSEKITFAYSNFKRGYRSNFNKNQMIKEGNLFI